MGKLLRFEFAKIFTKKSTYVCFAIALIFIGFLSYVNIRFAGNTGLNLISGSEMMIRALSMANFVMLMGIAAALYVCDDYSNNVFKNVYSKGYSRSQVYMVKWIVSTVVTMLEAVFILLVGWAIGQIFGKGESTYDGDFWTNICLLLLLVFALHAVYFMVAMATRMINFSVIFILVIPDMIILLLTGIMAIFGEEYIEFRKYWIDYYYQELSGGYIDNDIIRASLICGAVYTVIAIAVGLIANRRKEF